MSEMLTPERKRDAYEGRNPFNRRGDVLAVVVGLVTFCLFVAFTTWLAAGTAHPVAGDFIG